jgi:conjugal transfer pilus assembly protein TraU
LLFQTKNRFAFITLALCLLITTANAGAVCKDDILNPITDIDWQGIFPVSIGGIELIGSDIDTAPPNLSSAWCTCTNGGNVTVGFSASFWEPARIIETVKDPYCFPSIGIQLENDSTGYGSGSTTKQTVTKTTQDIAFQNAHWIIFPAWTMLSLFTDMPCLEKSPFDIGYLTEVDPTWANSLLASSTINPDALLFANPIAQLADIPDSVAALANYPLDPLFWVMGSQGSAYPLTGSLSSGNYTEANFGMAERMIFKLGRELILQDPGVSACGPVVTPIWVKTNYRLQIARPVRGSEPQPIGKSGFLWASAKNPPGGAGNNSSDNFLWIMFRRVACCIGISI